MSRQRASRTRRLTVVAVTGAASLVSMWMVDDRADAEPADIVDAEVSTEQVSTVSLSDLN